MTTLIIRKNKDGATTGRCDARCYDAKGKKCKCLCGGVNHGRGFNGAASRTNEFREVILDSRKPGEAYVMQF